MTTQTHEELFTTLEQMGENDRFFLPIEDQQDDVSLPAHIVSPLGNAELWNRWKLNSYEINAGTKLLVDLARTEGLEIQALCGHRWVPTQVANTHAVCEPCMRIAQIMMGEEGE
jgi:hypothetical protein